MSRLKKLSYTVLAFACPLFLAGGSFVTFSARADAPQAAIPELRQPQEFWSQLNQIKQFYQAGFGFPTYDIIGEKPFGIPVLVADEIHFHSGSSLVLANVPDGAQGVFIITKRLYIEGPSEITWRPIVPMGVPPPRARAADGAFGRADGEAGGPGAPGESGNVGFNGRSAPNLLIVALKIEGSGLKISLNGQAGGPGGAGQDGGFGGQGANGASAASSLFSCKTGPGPGGDAGDGGKGGPGGKGGNGGDGGQVVVLSSDETWVDKIKVYNAGGSPGEPGLPGHGGDAGSPGLGGIGAPPYCLGAGQIGSKGARGTDGDPTLGRAGSEGLTGALYNAPLQEKLANLIFSGEP